MDVTIKDVPEGAEDNVRELARVAVLRFKKKEIEPLPEPNMESFDEANPRKIISEN